MSDKIKKSDFTSGLFWNAIDTYSAQIIQFVVGVILARLLFPSDYGLIGMTLIFTCVAEVIITAGFPTALIRKQNCSQVDLSTVFWFNLVVGLFLYIAVYIIAPYAAIFYEQPVLSAVIRVISITFFVNSIAAVSSTLLKIQLRFKDAAKITMYASFITGIIAIILAYRGFGVWSLVIQAITSSILRVVLICIKAKWLPSFCFSSRSFIEMFGFGSKLLGSNLINQIFSNIYIIVIGKFFSASTLGFFSRADGYSRLVPNNIQSIIQKTLFPLISKVKDDDIMLKVINLKIIRTSSFLIFPASFILAGLAYPLLSLMLSDKWLPTAPLLQILCITTIFDHISSINNDFVAVKGHSEYIISWQLITKFTLILALIISLPLGLIPLAMGKGLTTVISFYFSCRYLDKTLRISVWNILNELKGMLLTSVVIGCILWLITMVVFCDWIILIGLLITSALLYLLCAKIFFPTALKEICNYNK